MMKQYLQLAFILAVNHRYLFVNGQFYGSDGAYKMEYAVKTQAREVRLADKAKRGTRNQIVSNYIAASRQKEYNDYKERGSKYLADGKTVILENAALDVRSDDPRSPTGFGNPFYEVNHVTSLSQISTSPSTETALSKIPAETFPSPWKQINGIGSYGFGGQDAMKPQLVTLLNASPNKIIRFLCESCIGSHQEIYYKRLSGVPSNMVDIIETSWTTTSNQFDVDFRLYSSYDDAVNGVNPWQYCGGFDQSGVGFPGYCGPTGEVLNQYSNFATRIQPDVAYYVEDANGDFATFAMMEEESAMEATRKSQPETAKAKSICNYLPKLDDRLTCLRSCAYGERTDNKPALKLCHFQKLKAQIWKTKETTSALETTDGSERGKIIKPTHPLGDDVGLPGKFATY